MLKITRILLQSRKSNLILIGEPGVGKTGIVEGFAQLLEDGKLPEALGRPAVRRVDILSTMPMGGEKDTACAARLSLFIGRWARRPRSVKAGTKYRGEFEERVEALVREASQEPKPILFIDEIHWRGGLRTALPMS
ncbi:MAG: AAA family ATPase [Verrucomicrobia bacterium]|nr:AAA family ATPase [Verrucomicrobiota bacterium]